MKMGINGFGGGTRHAPDGRQVLLRRPGYGLGGAEMLYQRLAPFRPDARDLLQAGMDRRLLPQVPVVNDAEAVGLDRKSVV